MAPQLAVAEEKMEKKLEEAKKRHGREERKEVVGCSATLVHQCLKVVDGIHGSKLHIGC